MPILNTLKNIFSLFFKCQIYKSFRTIVLYANKKIWSRKKLYSKTHSWWGKDFLDLWTIGRSKRTIPPRSWQWMCKPTHIWHPYSFRQVLQCHSLCPWKGEQTGLTLQHLKHHQTSPELLQPWEQPGKAQGHHASLPHPYIPANGPFLSLPEGKNEHIAGLNYNAPFPGG